MAGERYAQMRNVWFLPSTAALSVWLGRLGFENIRVVDINHTTLDEQRATPWMETFERFSRSGRYYAHYRRLPCTTKGRYCR